MHRKSLFRTFSYNLSQWSECPIRESHSLEKRFFLFFYLKKKTGRRWHWTSHLYNNRLLIVLLSCDINWNIDDGDGQAKNSKADGLVCYSEPECFCVFFLCLSPWETQRGTFNIQCFSPDCCLRCDLCRGTRGDTWPSTRINGGQSDFEHSGVKLKTWSTKKAPSIVLLWLCGSISFCNKTSCPKRCRASLVNWISWGHTLWFTSKIYPLSSERDLDKTRPRLVSREVV